MMPELTDQEIRRYVALGEAARTLLHSGETDKALAAYRAQIALFPPNPEPYVGAAMIEAGRGHDHEAMRLLHAAVARGYFDLGTVERAEAATKIRRSMAFLELQEAVPRLVEAENAWAGWDAFRTSRPPESVASALSFRDRGLAGVARMAPVLGPRLVRLWRRAFDRATAALLESYAAERPDAPDRGEALKQLTTLYAGGSLLRWETVPDDAAARLDKIAALILEKFPSGRTRAAALVCRALAANARRDSKGRLASGAAAAIRTDLEAVLDADSDSPFAMTALEGLVTTAAETGHMDEASRRFKEFSAAHADDTSVLEKVRSDLGTLALYAGGIPAFHASGLDGSPFASSALRGKTAVVDFWATWCRPCVDEFQTLRKIAAKHGSDVVLVGVNLDDADEIADDALRKWVAEQKLPGRQVRDGKSWDSDLVRAFGVKEIPFTVVVASDGTVKAVGERGKKLEKAVAAAVR